MANAQIVFTDDFTLELAHKFCEEPDIVQAVDRYYYEGGHISPLIETLKQHDGMEMYQRFYEEIIAAFQQEHYQLACTGLFPWRMAYLQTHRICRDALTMKNE